MKEAFLYIDRYTYYLIFITCSLINIYIIKPTNYLLMIIIGSIIICITLQTILNYFILKLTKGN